MFKVSDKVALKRTPMGENRLQTVEEITSESDYLGASYCYGSGDTLYILSPSGFAVKASDITIVESIENS